MENSTNKKLIMFDFDGVLVNTLPMAYEIHKEKNPHFSWDSFKSLSDGNFHEAYSRMLEDGKHVHPENYPEDYNKNLITLTIEDILHDAVLALASEYVLVIVSSTSNSFIESFLKKENLFECFAGIYGFDFDKSKVIKIKSILEKYKILPQNTVFITDTLGDIKEANECNVPTIGVTWGLHTKETLKKGKLIDIIDNPQDLVPTIKNVLK